VFLKIGGLSFDRFLRRYPVEEVNRRLPVSALVLCSKLATESVEARASRCAQGARTSAGVALIWGRPLDSAKANAFSRCFDWLT
jgi:hypothetical protein